ncbi:MAG: hypothetical protein NDJ92_04635 [Thermoanaerobaculia bacterium]|nr:hypothetical protein [Thermoanaerobaculia bacterium]
MTGGDERSELAETGGRWWLGSVLILVLFAIVVAIVDPRGDFPLNDDWNFALATWHFAETGTLMLSRFSAMTLKTQILWGALWTWLFGESFTVLRASTLFLSAATLLVVDSFLRRLGVKLALRILTLAVFLFNPIFLWSAFTYMTQVPYVFLSVAAMYCAWRGLTEDRLGWMWVAAVAIAASYFLRQTGLANGLAALAVVAVEYHRRRDRRTLVLGLPVLLAVAAFGVMYLFTKLLEGYPDQIDNHFLVWHQAPLKLLKYVVLVPTIWTIVNLQLTFLFIVPLALPFVLFGFPKGRGVRLAATAAIALFAVVVSHLVATISLLPYQTPGNILINLGLGPPTMRDTWIFGLPYPWQLHTALRTILTAASVIGAALLLVGIAARVRYSAMTEARERFAAFAAFHATFATALLFISGIYFDRYALDSMWAVTLLLPLFIDWSRVGARVAAVALVIAVAFFSVMGVQEYLRWNRNRWEAFSWLSARGVTLKQLDGGYEINQYLIGGFHGEQNIRKVGYSVTDDEYIIALNHVPGYRVIHAIPFTSFLGLRRGAVYAEQRITGYSKRVTLPDGTICDPTLIEGCGGAILDMNAHRPTHLWLEEDSREIFSPSGSK